MVFLTESSDNAKKLNYFVSQDFLMRYYQGIFMGSETNIIIMKKHFQVGCLSVPKCETILVGSDIKITQESNRPDNIIKCHIDQDM